MLFTGYFEHICHKNLFCCSIEIYDNVLVFEFVYYREETRTNIDEQQYDGPAGMVPDGVIESTYNEIVLNFDDMNLKEELLRGIYAYGFEKPSAIQQRAILPCIRERDVIAQAQSGKFNIFFFIIYVDVVVVSLCIICVCISWYFIS